MYEGQEYRIEPAKPFADKSNLTIRVTIIDKMVDHTGTP